MCTRERIIAVDFDGCLCENAWPDIGEAKQDVIDALLLRQKQGAKVILWTCRVGDRLDAAVRWCADRGIVFDSINKNLPSMITTYGNDCRKVYADEYWDDKACNPSICNVSIPLNNDNPMLYKFRSEEESHEYSDSRIAGVVGSILAMNYLRETSIVHKDDNCFLETPINPEEIRLLRETWNPKDYPGQTCVVPTNHISARSEVFVVLREMARMIVNGTEWNKKARIVLEYDPQCPKMEIKTFMERDEATPSEDRGLFRG